MNKILMIILVVLFTKGCSQKPICEDRILAYVMAQDFVKRKLRSPSTANFPSITADGVSSDSVPKEGGGCNFLVYIYVDAQNTFGATVRQNYAVLLSPDDEDGKSWSLESLVEM